MADGQEKTRRMDRALIALSEAYEVSMVKKFQDHAGKLKAAVGKGLGHSAKRWKHISSCQKHKGRRPGADRVEPAL